MLDENKCCYACGEPLVLDFIPMIKDADGESFEFADVDNPNAKMWVEEWEFEVCSKCGAAQ